MSELDDKALPSRPGFREGLWVAVLAAIAIWLLFQNQVAGVFGIYNDDGQYLIGALAMVTGRGYADLSGPGLPMTLRFPIGFSSLLVPIAWATRGNLWAYVFGAKCLVLVFAVGFLAASYIYLRRYCDASVGMATVTVLLVMLSQTFIEFGTTVMSDLPYALVAIACLCAAEAAFRPESPSYLREGLLALTVLAALQLRYAGVALLGALVLEAWRRRGWARLGRIMVWVCLAWIPWLIYRDHLVNTSYAMQFAQAFDTARREGYSLLTVALSFYDLFFKAIPGLFVPPMWLANRGPLVWVWFPLEAAIAGALVLSLRNTILAASSKSRASMLAPSFVIGTLALDLTWNTMFTNLGAWQHLRLLLPAFPFLIYFVLAQFSRLFRNRPFALCLVLAMVALIGTGTWQWAAWRHNRERDVWQQLADALRFAAVSSPKDSPLLTQFPPLAYLLTARTGIQLSQDPAKTLSLMD
ncbi:MAG: hypothetical protein KGR26_00910, partial [Cyanobacteria bacterium REEB65]|nr:hypothetical protein [Cyanobacteria bacterium REEB65]